MALATNRGVRGYISRRREYGQLEARLKEAQARLADKQTNLARAQKDDEFLEQEARRNLGLVRPEEIEFRFVPGAGSSASSGDSEIKRTIPPLPAGRGQGLVPRKPAATPEKPPEPPRARRLGNDG